MDLVAVVDTVVLWVHLFSAVLFIGGSFFMWLVLVPVSYSIERDEATRTLLVGKMARGFAKWSNISLGVLVVTGLYNASWYLPSTTPFGRELLMIKMGLVGLLIVLIYTHGLYYGRKISRFAREGKVDELQRVRRTSKLISYANLGLMVAILLVVATMQVWG